MFTFSLLVPIAQDKEFELSYWVPSVRIIGSSRIVVISQDTTDLSRDRNARNATLAKTIAKAVAREMAKAHAHYQALLNDRGTAAIQTSLKVTSGANGFKVMDPFDWTKDKAIYQRWQL